MQVNNWLELLINLLKQIIGNYFENSRNAKQLVEKHFVKKKKQFAKNKIKKNKTLLNAKQF